MAKDPDQNRSKSERTEKAARGQTIETCYPMDSSFHDVPNGMGSKMGGGPTNVAHSLPGATAKQGGNASKDKPDGFR